MKYLIRIDQVDEKGNLLPILVRTISADTSSTALQVVAAQNRDLSKVTK